MNKGYITLSRKVFESELWKTNEPKSLFEAWIDLIQSARFEKGTTIVKEKFIMVNRGELVASLRYLAERWNWDKNKVSRILKYWEQSGQITRQQKMGETLIKLTKYEDYNPKKGQQSGQREDSVRTAQGQREDSVRTNNKKVNNGNNGKEGEESAPSQIAFGKAPKKELVKEYFYQQLSNKNLAEDWYLSFYDKYDGVGWVINGDPILRWHSVANKFIRNCEKNEKKYSNNTNPEGGRSVYA